MAYYQALDTIVEAAEKLKDDPQYVVLMVGNGPERGRIEELARSKGLDNVQFPQVSYEESGRLYSIAAVAVATFRNVAVAATMRPSKLFPAMACAVPVIFAGKGEAAELIEEANCGLAVEAENAEALAGAIRKLTDDEEQRRKMGANGRALVEREYSWRGIVRHWLEELVQAKERKMAA
jgi:glycosyltransferase involved in cell wall biosynthesis